MIYYFPLNVFCMCLLADAVSQVRRIKDNLAPPHATQQWLPFLLGANNYQKAQGIHAMGTQVLDSPGYNSKYAQKQTEGFDLKPPQKLHPFLSEMTTGNLYGSVPAQHGGSLRSPFIMVAATLSTTFCCLHRLKVGSAPCQPTPGVLRLMTTHAANVAASSSITWALRQHLYPFSPIVLKQDILQTICTTLLFKRA